MENQYTWDIINSFFKEDSSTLVSHHLQSFNLFWKEGLMRIFREKNPIQILKQQDEKTKEYKSSCKLFLGGKNGKMIYFGKPIIYDENKTQFLYPNDARLRNMTYGMSIHYDVEIEFEVENAEKVMIKKTIKLEKIYLGRFPIMIQSDFCILKGLHRDVRFNMGECRNDPGGYFIIDGKEKVIVSQEKFADNMLYIRESGDENYSFTADIRTASEDTSKPVRTLSVRIVKPSTTLTNNQIVVLVPNVRKPIPLFILFRALGVLSDKEIIEHVLLDIEENKTYMELLIPSIHDASKFFTQELALNFMKTFTKGKTISHIHEILSNFFLPNVGELNYKDKALFLGKMVFDLLKVSLNQEKPTDRDNFKFKRVEVSGILIGQLFREYYSLMFQNIFKKIDKEYYFHPGQYQGFDLDGNPNMIKLITNNYGDYFRERDVEDGFKKAFKGNWGAQSHTKRLGVVQDLNRLSYNSFISHLRKINLPLDASAKVIGPRLLHGSQWGIIDPLDTPDGGNVGLHKHMTIMAKISTSISGKDIFQLIRKQKSINLLSESSLPYLNRSIKISINGTWMAVTSDPKIIIDLIKFNKHTGKLPIMTSISWDRENKHIEIFSDGGRLCRPIYYKSDKNKWSFERKELSQIIKEKSWNDLLEGFDEKNTKQQAILEFMDSSEANTALISINPQKKDNYTNLEIHPSLILGVMGNMIAYPENNQLPRNLFSCGQSKQAVSLYHSNYLNRIDKMGVVLNNGEIPLVKSRYLELINREEHPYGENVIVAIACYSGYNVEDSILFNKASVDRGLFRTTYYNMYESKEESTQVATSLIDSKFVNILDQVNVSGVKPEFDYSYLDKNGLIEENTKIDDRISLIGKITYSIDQPDVSLDASSFPKKGALGFVDKAFITEGEEGFRIAKVRIREERVPAIGDKFCSRVGQKGTVGLIIEEENMPFSKDGIRPDIIINPHAFPSRMTIGQLIEQLVGKSCLFYGTFGDCTAFETGRDKEKIFGDLLTEVGYHNSGQEVLYNGMTGEQIDTSIYIGPTYYMRLKHMVKDKINYRAKGPRTMLTRQAVQGRANDGGLRIGEMERDGLIAHGAASFLQESFLTRGDTYYMAVCNKSGMIAIFNKAQNLFLSPAVDGPVNFTYSAEQTLNIDNISKFGRSFSIVEVPYSFKLLLHELMSMNIQMRIITEDNINQIESLSFSNNLNILTQKEDIRRLKFQDRNKINAPIPEVLKETPDSLEKEDPVWTPIAEEKNTPMYASEVNYEKGDQVGYSLDDNKERVWLIGHIGPTKMVLYTYDLIDLPSNLLEKTENKALVSVDKSEIFKFNWSEDSPPFSSVGQFPVQNIPIPTENKELSPGFQLSPSPIETEPLPNIEEKLTILTDVPEGEYKKEDEEEVVSEKKSIIIN